MSHRCIDAHVKSKTQISLDPCYPFAYNRKWITLLPRHTTPSPTKPVLHAQLLSPGNVFVQFAFVEHPPLSVAHGSISVEGVCKAFTIRPRMCMKKVNRVNIDFTVTEKKNLAMKETNLCKKSRYPYNQRYRNKLEESLNLLRYSWQNNI